MSRNAILQDVRWSTRKRNPPQLYVNTTPTSSANTRDSTQSSRATAPDYEMSEGESDSESGSELALGKSLKEPEFTDEDDRHLIRYLATHLPDNTAEGRLSMMFYDDLVHQASENKKLLWASRHSAERWKMRYKTLQKPFDAQIEREIKRRQKANPVVLNATSPRGAVRRTSAEVLSLGKRRRLPSEEQETSDRSISVPGFLKHIQRTDELATPSPVDDLCSASATLPRTSTTPATSLGNDIEMHEEEPERCRAFLPLSTFAVDSHVPPPLPLYTCIRDRGTKQYKRSYVFHTTEGDLQLAQYLAIHAPDEAQSPRSSILLYRDLIKKATARNEYSWALSHTESSWRSRYLLRQEWFDGTIDRLVSAAEQVQPRVDSRLRKEPSDNSECIKSEPNATSSKSSYTEEEDRSLIEYLVELHLQGSTLKRGGIRIYDDLVAKGNKDPEYKWASKRTAWAWNRRYRANRERFDVKIEKLICKAELKKKRWIHALGEPGAGGSKARNEQAVLVVSEPDDAPVATLHPRNAHPLHKPASTRENQSLQSTHPPPRPPWRSETPTSEEKNLAEYLAEHAHQGSHVRRELATYERLVNMGYENSRFSWTLERSAKGWLDCYTSKADWFDQTITTLAHFRQDAQSWPAQAASSSTEVASISVAPFAPVYRKIKASSNPKKYRLAKRTRPSISTAQPESVPSAALKKSAARGTPHNEEDDMRLARYMALRVPDPAAGGRLSVALYSDLLEKAASDPVNYGWAGTRTTWAWFGRYRSQREWFDDMIEKIVAEKDGRSTGKG